MHGKVKLARNLETGENVAIKIIPRFSKSRRLIAKPTQPKSKKEIAILKKIRHPNVVALLEIIDDPELDKIYMILEHVELGEIVWRKKGLPHICLYERRRVEREMRGEKPSPEEERLDRHYEKRQALKEARRAGISQGQIGQDNWGLEYGANEDEADAEFNARSYTKDDIDWFKRPLNVISGSVGSMGTSRAPSRTSLRSISRAGTPLPLEHGQTSIPDEDDLETPGLIKSSPTSSSALAGAAFAPIAEDVALRVRSPSMADSIMSHISSVDYSRAHDPYTDDFSYVPCFTLDQARETFRDTVMGLEYLHFEGIVHRDIKPANLLRTKDHRVKISDFGVSYFGRPLRDGDPDATAPGPDAPEFDSEVELARTVGTPAFFAPELCATNISNDDARPKHQPTEQIDVWSLGVTLYCLIFARIPFLAEDEYKMWSKIATEDVYIPRRRLRPVDPSTKPIEKSLYTRVNSEPYRNDDELLYEEVDPDLVDLLTQMLTKNPDKRIRLRDVKRHPWVTRGISDVATWLDKTDPSQRASGRKIQVDEREVARAVVPLTFLERARSAVKKAVGKVMHPRGDRTESVSSRRRAASSAASSSGDSPVVGLGTPFPRDGRRRSIRPDDYFASLLQPSDHPLTQSLTVNHCEVGSSAGSPHGAEHSPRQRLEPLSVLTRDHCLPDRQQTSPISWSFARHSHTRSANNAFLSLTAAPQQVRTSPPTPLPPFEALSSDPSVALRKARDTRASTEDLSRARSMDRGLFASNDKRAEPKVSLSTAVAPGNVHFTPQRPRPARSIDPLLGQDRIMASFAPASSALTGYQHGQFKSEPNMHDKQHVPLEMEERPLTAQRVEGWSESSVMQTRIHRLPSPALSRSRTPAGWQEAETRQHPIVDTELKAALSPLPPSPGAKQDISQRLPPSRGETLATAISSSSTSMGALTTPLTSPSETASPVYMINPSLTKDSVDPIMAFQSDPSLPALLSSTSSVSADLEGEFLGNPGVVGHAPLIDTTDSLTPPALVKESGAGFPLEEVQQGAVPVRLDESARRPQTLVAHRRLSRHHHGRQERDHDDDSSDSDDDVLMMGRPKKNGLSKDVGKLFSASRRRDTNASVGSTETAKKLVVDSD